MKSYIVLSFMFILLLVTSAFPVVPMGADGSAPDVEEGRYGKVWGLVTERYLGQVDVDANRIHDEIDQLAQGGSDVTVDIYIELDRAPTDRLVGMIEDLGIDIYYRMNNLWSISAHGVPVRLVDEIADLPHVVLVEKKMELKPMLDVSAEAITARNGHYSPKTAWDKGYTGKDIVIAVLDTGVDDDHESLSGKFVAGVDLSNPGFVITGNPDDRHGHGTHCAGTAIGSGGDSDYIGVAKDAQLVDVKIGTDVGNTWSLQEGIEWCIENKETYDIKIISLSYGQATGSSDGSDTNSQAANQAVDQGLFVVVAAGNSGPDNNGLPSPGAADKVITVANIDDMNTEDREDDEIASSSSRGPREDDEDDDPYDELKPEISAPGTRIMAPRHSEVDQGTTQPNGYTNMTGTSMACPHIAGVVACMLEANPDLTPAEVKEILIKTAEARGEPSHPHLSSKYNGDYGYGIVDTFLAVMLGIDQDFPTNGGGGSSYVSAGIDTPGNGDKIKKSINVTGTATSDFGTIDLVEISINNGSWDATTPMNGSYDRWYYTWEVGLLRNGNYSIKVRALSSGEYSPEVEIWVMVKHPKQEEDSWLPGFELPLVACGLMMMALFVKRRW